MTSARAIWQNPDFHTPPGGTYPSARRDNRRKQPGGLSLSSCCVVGRVILEIHGES